MTKYLLVIAALGPLAACSREPKATAPAAVTVVAGHAAVAAAKAIVLPTTKASLPEAAPSPIPKLLSVEESARINTPEMWSEPLRAD